MTWTQVEEPSPAERLEASEKPNAESMRPTHFPSGVEIDMAGETLEPLTTRKKPVFKKERKLSSSAHDPVNSPSHYTSGGIETIDYMQAKLTPDEFIGYLKGNVIKYTSRAGKKIDMKEDYAKAQWYMNRLLKTLEDK
jgi:hypothetical protein